MKGCRFIEEEKPGLYECHLVYTLGGAKKKYYIVVCLLADTFIKAFRLSENEIYIKHRTMDYRVKENLLTLITDPEAYISIPT